MKKLAILGASYLQVPLINKAIEMGLETYVFAWEDGAIGKDLDCHYYPISTTDKEAILLKCKEIGIHGIVTIGTDIAMPTISYISTVLNLNGNSLRATLNSTDKFEMRKVLASKNIPCPRFSFYEEAIFKNKEGYKFPLIVKPTNRSGSRGVTRVNSVDEANNAIKKALGISINKRVIVEEFIQTKMEFSIEFISFKGIHHPLTITEKITTGAPYFCELEHHQPPKIKKKLKEKIFQLTIDSLNAIGIENGASHTEIILDIYDNLYLVELAGRMGGDFIGSHLVQLSTGFDFLMATIDVALNNFDYNKYLGISNKPFSGVYFTTARPGKVVSIRNNAINSPSIIYSEPLCKVGDVFDGLVDGSDKRSGFIIYSSDKSKPIDNPEHVIDIITE